MKTINISIFKLILLCLCISSWYACSSRKDTATSRGMQNLTARYNYIYNANVALNNHETELAENYKDNYDQVLPAYIGPEVDNSQLSTSLNIKPMDDIIKKAQVIILEKSFSNYIDESYILLGKANFFNGNYYAAAEYLDYAAKTYKNNTKSYTEALNWKARSLMQTNRMTAANLVLDSLEAALPDLKSGKDLAEPFATMAQMSIYQSNDAAAISYLNDAVKASDKKQNRIRWTYILAQLYEKQNDKAKALESYRKVERSNAPFEMYFNAKLNQIRIRTGESASEDQKQQLLALLKDDKNIDYNDQVYFQIAENYATDSAYDEAETNYQRSVQVSTNNAYQKGLSYLRIADLNFKSLKNYLKAKAYYDSTVNTLPKNYPDYNLILKKSLNLQYLTSRYETISLQDTLQAIAGLPESERLLRIQAYVNPVVDKQVNSIQAPTYNYQPLSSQGAGPQSSFYFSNPSAIGLGFSDFKKKWGNRKLETNWRQSIRSSSQATIQYVASNIATLSTTGDTVLATVPNKEALIQQYSSSLPVTPELKIASNQKIINAYYEIASFYLQELNDPKEAEQVYQLLLQRFPENKHLAATYYSIYLIKNTSNPGKANEYKNKILQNFPGSVYAKTIIDPSFSLKQSEADVVANRQYNQIFEHYLNKDFGKVIEQVNASENTQANFLAPQLGYLKAIAVGRTSAVDSLITHFNRIISSYPDDQIITPLVKDHLNYITLNLESFRKRAIALVDFDPNEPPFFGPVTSTPTLAKTTTNNQPPATAPVTPKTASPVTVTPPANVPPVAEPSTSAIKSDGTFNNATSTTYYFVVDVADASLTLSSSRFGIGQFNRGNYAGSNLRHQLKEFDNDQLIYVGNFSSFEDAKAYANGITPQLKQIMKVPVNIYTSFIISKENFDKLSNKPLLDKYLEFYKNNY